MNSLRAALAERFGDDVTRWLDRALRRIAQEPAAIRTLFPAVTCQFGHAPLESADPLLRGWTADDVARGLMLAAIPLTGDELAEEIAALYRYGNSAERRGVLRGLVLLDLGDAALPIIRDALRTDDPGLIVAALGPYAAANLDPPHFRQGVLRCLALGVPLAAVHGLHRRADLDLARMLVDFVHERVLAGHQIPPDVWPLIDAYPGILGASAVSDQLGSDFGPSSRPPGGWPAAP